MVTPAKLIFITKTLKDRFDCNYYNPRYKPIFDTIKQSKYEVKDLGDETVAYVTDGEHGNPIYVDDGIIFLRGINITNEGIDLENNIKYITETENNKILKSELRPNDILITIVGSIGKAAIVPEGIPKINISRDIARVVPSKNINSKYLLFYLESSLGQMQLQRETTGSIQSGVYLENLKKLKIILPPKEIQDSIAEECQRYKELSKENLEKYHNNFTDIKKIISENLKIELKEKVIKNFTINFSVLNDRLDAFSYSPNYNMIIESLKKSESNGYCKLLKGSELNIPKSKISKNKNKTNIFKYIDLGNTEKNLGKIKGFEEDLLINLPNRARQIIHENDVLLPRPLGSTEGVIIVPKEYDGQLCSTGFILIRPKTHDEAIMLWAILKSELVQKQFFYLQSGSLQPEITPKNFRDRVLIPMPNKEIQEKIINDISKKVEEATDFMEKYKEYKEKTKQTFLDLLTNL